MSDDEPAFDLTLYGIIQGEVKMRWETPILKQDFACLNCDAEHDGVDWHPNHAADAWCRYYEDA